MFFFLSSLFDCYFYVYGYFTYVFRRTMCVQFPWRPEEGIRTPGTRVRNGWTTKWVLGNPGRSSACKHRAISPAPGYDFDYVAIHASDKTVKKQMEKKKTLADVKKHPSKCFRIRTVTVLIMKDFGNPSLVGIAWEYHVYFINSHVTAVVAWSEPESILDVPQCVADCLGVCVVFSTSYKTLLFVCFSELKVSMGTEEALG